MVCVGLCLSLLILEAKAFGPIKEKEVKTGGEECVRSERGEAREVKRTQSPRLSPLGLGTGRWSSLLLHQRVEREALAVTLAGHLLRSGAPIPLVICVPCRGGGEGRPLNSSASMHMAGCRYSIRGMHRASPAR